MQKFIYLAAMLMTIPLSPADDDCATPGKGVCSSCIVVYEVSSSNFRCGIQWLTLARHKNSSDGYGFWYDLPFSSFGSHLGHGLITRRMFITATRTQATTTCCNVLSKRSAMHSCMRVHFLTWKGVQGPTRRLELGCLANDLVNYQLSAKMSAG